VGSGTATRELSPQELRSLFIAYRERGDESARERIIESFAPLVESIARQHARRREPVEDLRQEGFIGLIKAVEMYDIRRGVKFITYATHLIQGEIRHYLRDRTGIIREPGWLHELNGKIVRAVEELTQTHGRFPTVAEIAELVGVEERSVQEVLRTRPTFQVGSTDIPEQGPDASASVDQTKIRSAQLTSLELPIEDRVVLTNAMRNLRQLEQQVIDYFFFEDMTQTEIAKKLDISCNYVSHLIRASLTKLRRFLMRQEHKEASLRVRAALDRRRAFLEAKQATGVRDTVTDLYSEAHLEERLHEEVQRARRYGHELSIVLLEVEGFGKFVGSRTERAGEQALRQVAGILIAGVRKVDVLTRYGPIGFGLVLPHTGETSERVAHRLVQAIGKERIGANTPRARGLTMRAGVAVYPLDGLTTDEIMQAARDALSRSGGAADKRVLRAGATKAKPADGEG